MIDAANSGLPPEVLENGGNFLENEDSEEKSKEITIEKTYNGENPQDFVLEILKEARDNGVPLTFKEVLKQIKEASESVEEKEFSFDNMQSKSADLIIPPGITLIFKFKKEKKEIVEEKEEPEQEEDDDYDDEDEDLNKKKREENKPEKKRNLDIFESERKKVMDVLDSENGNKLDKSLEEIKRIGLLLVEKLHNLGKSKSSEDSILESEEVVTSRLELFKFLDEAQIYGDNLTRILKEEYDFTPRRDLVPSGYILAYFKDKYRKNGIEIPNEFLERNDSTPNTSGSVRGAVDQRLN